MRLIVLFILLAVLVNFSKGQENSVKMIASPRFDSILLRWAPNNQETWRLANQYGYIIKRYTIIRGKKVVDNTVEVVLNPTPLKPLPIQEWESFADDKYVSIAAECIFNSIYNGVPVGLNPHVAYKQYQEDQHRFSFALYAADQSLQAARLSGLYFADKTALPKEKYLYRVFINCPDSLAVDTASAFTGLSEYEPLPKPLELTALWEDKKVELSWNILYLSRYYNSYFIEKSTDLGTTYHRISENNAVQLSGEGVTPEYQYKSDSLSNNNDVFYYRVRGITPFGETGPPSDSVFGRGQLPVEVAPMLTNEELIDNKAIKLDWIFPSELNNYIEGFKVYRSLKPKGEKKLIWQGKDPLQRSFTDSAPLMTNYYLLSVYNKQKEKVTPFQSYVARIDSFPPAPPVNFKGIIDSAGAVHLHWNRNTEDDMDGYRIYRENNPNFEFALVFPEIIRDTQFIDSIELKVLNKNIYYCIKAVDVRDNQSKFSQVLTLKRPDIIPPVPPVLENISPVEDNFPAIRWINSSSTDVVSHSIYRKTPRDTMFNEIATLAKNDSVRTTYIDRTTKPGISYIYQIKARDDSKLLSAASKNGYITMPGGKEEIIKLKKRAYTDKVKLSWTVQMDKPVKKILIYRGAGEGGLKVIGFSQSDSYWDLKLIPELEYTYCIMVEFADGTTSAMSKPVKVKL